MQPGQKSNASAMSSRITKEARSSAPVGVLLMTTKVFPLNAYTNEAAARKTFALYRKCRDVYLRCYARGYGVARLTVAA